MARNYCCCESNLKASTILAIVFIALRIIQLGISGYSFANVHNLQIDEEDKEKIELALKIGFALNGLFLLIDICLLIGTLKKITILLWVWLIIAGISLVYGLVATIVNFSIQGIIVVALSILVTIWAMLAVYGSIQEIKEDK